jgi:hypothetical protein
MLVGKSHTPVAFATRPTQEIDPEFVCAILREVVAHEHAAARAERQAFDVIVLLCALGDAVLMGLGTSKPTPNRRTADVPCDRQILLEPRLTDLQDARHVVESIARVVGRQQRPHVHLESEQVTNGVTVLRAVEAVKRLRASRVRGGRRMAIQLALEKPDQRGARGRLRTRPAGRRHQAGPQFQDHLFPHLGVFADLRQINRIEREPAGVGLVPLVVARNTVPLQHRMVIGRGVAARRKCLCGRDGSAPHRCEHQHDRHARHLGNYLHDISSR